MNGRRHELARVGYAHGHTPPADVSPRSYVVSTITKGTRWRRRVEDYLIALGYETRARAWMEPGDDITARRGMLELSVEAKDHRALHLSEWVDQAERNAPDGAIPVVFAHRLGKAGVEGAYVIMSGAAFAELLESL